MGVSLGTMQPDFVTDGNLIYGPEDRKVRGWKGITVVNSYIIIDQ